MKKTAKLIVTLVFCLTLISATFVPAFAASVAQVKGVKATNVTYNSATLTWAKASRVSGYEVENYNASTKKWKKVGSDLKSSVNSLKLAKLTTGTTYKYRVRAFSKSIFSSKKTYGAYSATVSVKPLPVKVTSFKASSVTSTTAKLTWTKVSGATGYVIKRYVNKAWTTFKTVKGANSLTLTGLVPNATYQLRIAPYTTVSKKNIYGAYSSTLTVKPTVSKVSGLKISATATSAKVTWTKASDVTGYKVVLTDANKKTILSKNVTTTAYSLTNLVPNAKYTLTVNAYKTVGKTTYSGAKTTATVIAKLSAPTSLKPSATANSFSVSYTKAAYANGYTIVLYKDGKEVQRVKTTATSYKFSNLVPNASYNVKIASYVTVSGKTYSSSYAASSAVKTTFLAPTSIKPSATAASFSVSYAKAAYANGYTIVLYKDGKEVQRVKTTATSYKFGNLVTNANYNVKIASYITVSGKTYSSSYAASSVVKTSIAAPTGLKVSKYGTTSLTLSWSKAADASSYELQQYVNGSWTTLTQTTATSYNISNLKVSTTYKFRIRSILISDFGTYKSAYSPEFSATTGITPVTGLVAEPPSVTYIKLKWNPVDGADGYIVSSPEIGKIDVDKPEVNINSLTSSTTYTFTVNAYKKQGNTKPLSDDAKVTAKTIYIFSETADTSSYISNKASSCILRWTPVPNATYDVYKLYIGEGYKLVKENIKENYIEISDGKTFKATATKDGAYTKISWANQNLPNGSKYTLEVASTDTKVWQKIGEYSETSVRVILAPNTNYIARVTAKYNETDTYYKVVIKDPESQTSTSRPAKITLQPELFGITNEIRTPKVAAFTSSSNNEVKTLYTLMLAQAITNTKHEQGKVNLAYKADITTDLDYIKIGPPPFQVKLDNIDELEDYLNKDSKPGEEVKLDDMFKDMNESMDITGTSQNGNLTYTENTGRKKQNAMSSMIIPEGAYAYLYDANKIADFSKKVKSIKVESAANGVQKITLVLNKEESSTKNKTTTNVHNGLAQGMAFDNQDLQGGEIKFSVGDTVIVAEINSNYTLNSYNVNSPIKMSAIMPTGMALFGNLELYLTGKMINNYKFTR